MNAENIIDMVKRFTDQGGVYVTWNESVMEKNSRNISVNKNNEKQITKKVLLLKEKFNPLQVMDSGVFGLTQDYTRYILTLPDVDIKKDMIITDSRNRKWKLGIVDWFDIQDVVVAKQSSLTEVM